MSIRELDYGNVQKMIAEAREMQENGRYINGTVFHTLADEVERLQGALSAASAVRSEGAAMYVPAYFPEAIKYRRVSAVAAASEPNEVCDTPLYASPVQTREDGIREALGVVRAFYVIGPDLSDNIAEAIEALLTQPEPKGDKS